MVHDHDLKLLEADLTRAAMEGIRRGVTKAAIERLTGARAVLPQIQEARDRQTKKEGA